TRSASETTICETGGATAWWTPSWRGETWERCASGSARTMPPAQTTSASRSCPPTRARSRSPSGGGWGPRAAGDPAARDERAPREQRTGMRVAGMRPGVALSTAAVVLIGLAAATAPTLRDWARPRPNVVLIVLDSLRADRVDLQGTPGGLTPFLSEFAAESTVYERAYAPSSWTVPVVASL